MIKSSHVKKNYYVCTSVMKLFWWQLWPHEEHVMKSVQYKWMTLESSMKQTQYDIHVFSRLTLPHITKRNIIKSLKISKWMKMDINYSVLIEHFKSSSQKLLNIKESIGRGLDLNCNYMEIRVLHQG